MTMFWEFFSFELKFRLKSISTYVYFSLWFFLSFFLLTSARFLSVSNDKVLLNGPFTNATLYISLTFFGIIVIAGIFGTSVLRDFQLDTYELIFTKPITKFGYLAGKWAGSFVTSVLCFSGLFLGDLAGILSPWGDHSRIAAGPAWWYWQPFFSITVVQIFFLGSPFFCVAALTRKLSVVYLQGIVVFMAYLIAATVFTATHSLEHFWSAIFDPVGFRLFDSITRYWTVVEKNSLPLGWSGVFLYNRLLWSSIGVLALVIMYALFPLSVEALTAAARGRRAAKAGTETGERSPTFSLITANLPLVHRVFGGRAVWAQFCSLTQVRVSNIVRELLFLAIVMVMVIFTFLNGHFVGRVNEMNVYPVTFLMVTAIKGNAFLFLLIVATIYAGELTWRERDTRFDGVYDALPVSVYTDWFSKLAALVVVELLLLTVMFVCGVLMQTLDGYFHYELLQYVKELYLITFPKLLIFTLLAVFLQTVLDNKFIAHGATIGMFVLIGILSTMGWENSLYLFGSTADYMYSDMNGYGHFVSALVWLTLYWLAMAAVLGVISIAFSRRGTDGSWPARWRLARRRAHSLVPIGVLFLLFGIGCGAWYFYNGHVLNEYLDTKAARHIQADYERNFKRYEGIPQPKITAVDASIDIFPERRAISGSAHIVLQNKTAVPISQIHILNPRQSVSNVRFDRSFHIASASPRGLYTIYALDQVLEPGEMINMNVDVAYATHGFMDGNERPELAYNGTFFDSSYFPLIGYNSGLELTDPRSRRDEHLGPVSELPPRGNPVGSVTNALTPDSDWISFRTIVSTSDDQIALAPGYLQHEWRANGRRYYEYSMGDVKTLNFYAYVSARYQVTRDTYDGAEGKINIEIYSDPVHPYDVDDMIAATKAGLAYYEKNFSPFQFRQFRILEFPRYRTFAQSFANTIPYTEYGFITRVLSPADIDFTYFGTAHELAHQWWGHQLVGARVEGSNMMSESLAEYSALRVMQKKYGDNQMRKFLKHELDGYLRGRSNENHQETPLDLVQRESYVWYQKGALVLYALSDYIGEEKLNLALHNFLLQYRYANATDSRSEPYPDTRQFVQALRAQTPSEFQYFIDDAFESIVLYDNRMVTASATPAPDKKYKVVLTVQARKFKADGSGNETPVVLNDYVDIGVFIGAKDHEVPIFLKKEKITQETQTFEVVVDQMPTRAGIDPYNKLIDRIPEDNMIDVSRP